MSEEIGKIEIMEEGSETWHVYLEDSLWTARERAGEELWLIDRANPEKSYIVGNKSTGDSL